MTKPRIIVLSLGGTITMTRREGAGITPTLSGADLVEAIPALYAIADVETRSLFGLPSASLTQTHLVTVANTITDVFSEGFDGAVIIQGTDTIEETAFVLDLLVNDDRPVVVTGAMRGPEAPGADGSGNILSAVIAASSRSLRSTGATVVLNDEIHAARFVQKSNTALPSAFTSPSAGRIGLIAEGRAHILLHPSRIHLSFGPLRNPNPPAVALINLSLGEDGRMLDGLPALNYAGAVIEGMGAGHIPADAVPRVVALMKTMPVVLSTRVRSGPVFTQTYGFDGSEIDLIRRGAIPSGMMGAQKARMLLGLLLSSGQSREAIANTFSAFSDI